MEQRGGSSGSTKMSEQSRDRAKTFSGLHLQIPNTAGHADEAINEELRRENSITMTPGGLKSATLWPWAQRNHARRSSVMRVPPSEQPSAHVAGSGGGEAGMIPPGPDAYCSTEQIRMTAASQSPTPHLDDRSGGSGGSPAPSVSTTRLNGNVPGPASTTATRVGKPNFFQQGVQKKTSLSKLERGWDPRRALFTPFTRDEHAEHYKWQDRLIPRDSPFCQSKGNLDVERQIPGYLGSSLRSLYYQNLFHSILDFRMRTHVLIVSSTYTLFWVVVAFLLILVEEDCNMRLGGSFIKAYIIAVETCMTIGYGMHDETFNGCWQMAVILSAASLISMILDGILIGLIFMTLTNPQRRAATVVFTDKAIIKLIDGEPHFVFQVAEIRKQSLLEAHIRCYCFKHCDVINPLTGQKSKSRVLQQFPMRLQSPDDELGGMLFLSTPLLVVHRIDEWSPLYRLYERATHCGVPDGTEAEHVRMDSSSFDQPERGGGALSRTNSGLQQVLSPSQSSLITGKRGRSQVLAVQHSGVFDDVDNLPTGATANKSSTTPLYGAPQNKNLLGGVLDIDSAGARINAVGTTMNSSSSSARSPTGGAVAAAGGGSSSSALDQTTVPNDLPDNTSTKTKSGSTVIKSAAGLKSPSPTARNASKSRLDAEFQVRFQDSRGFTYYPEPGASVYSEHLNNERDFFGSPTEREPTTIFCAGDNHAQYRRMIGVPNHRSIHGMTASGDSKHPKQFTRNADRQSSGVFGEPQDPENSGGQSAVDRTASQQEGRVSTAQADAAGVPGEQAGNYNIGKDSTAVETRISKHQSQDDTPPPAVLNNASGVFPETSRPSRVDAGRASASSLSLGPAEQNGAQLPHALGASSPSPGSSASNADPSSTRDSKARNRLSSTSTAIAGLTLTDPIKTSPRVSGSGTGFGAASYLTSLLAGGGVTSKEMMTAQEEEGPTYVGKKSSIAAAVGRTKDLSAVSQSKNGGAPPAGDLLQVNDPSRTSATGKIVSEHLEKPEEESADLFNVICDVVATQAGSSEAGAPQNGNSNTREQRLYNFAHEQVSTQLCARRDYVAPPLRMVDAERGMFTLYACPYCGESYVTKWLYRKHLVHNRGHGDHPAELPKWTKQMENEKKFGYNLYQENSKRLEHWDARKRSQPVNLLSQDYFEVLILVEGIEPFTSTTVQARHSYAFGQDIVINGDFMPCTFLKQDGTAIVDFGKFHQVVQSSEDHFFAAKEEVNIPLE
ncbi:unnamed protein product [Amoebophrya sp. A120]|nr:unnamed protein product [Amoebophrya sp. A120]|eukprot:GSA120T00010366001.1